MHAQAAAGDGVEVDSKPICASFRLRQNMVPTAQEVPGSATDKIGLPMICASRCSRSPSGRLPM